VDRRAKVSVISQATDRPKTVLYTVASLSLLAALIHLWVMPEHFQEWWGYGMFFLVATIAQVVYIPLLLRWPNRSVFLLGIAGNSAIVLLFLFTRVVGVPLFGPEAGEVEGVGIIDVCATSSEVAIVVALGCVGAVAPRWGKDDPDRAGPLSDPACGRPPAAPAAALGAALEDAYREVLAVDPLTQTLEEGTEPHPEFRRTFHDGLMRFLRNVRKRSSFERPEHRPPTLRTKA